MSKSSCHMCAFRIPGCSWDWGPGGDLELKGVLTAQKTVQLQVSVPCTLAAYVQDCFHKQ